MNKLLQEMEGKANRKGSSGHGKEIRIHSYFPVGKGDRSSGFYLTKYSPGSIW